MTIKTYPIKSALSFVFCGLTGTGPLSCLIVLWIMMLTNRTKKTTDDPITWTNFILAVMCFSFFGMAKGEL